MIEEQILERLAAIRSDGNIQPLPTMNVEKWQLGGGEMAVIEVFPSEIPPVRYKGRTCIRVGPRRGFATSAEERMLSEKRIDRGRTWDVRPCREASMDDLVLEHFALTYRLNAVSFEDIEDDDRPMDQQLASFRLFDLAARCPTNAGVFLLAKDALSFFPGAYVQYVQYNGTSQADDVIDDQRIVGDFHDILRDSKRLTMRVAEEHIIARPDEGDSTVFDYPPHAMHELLMNALIHRNYDESTTPIMVNHFSDRIEIQNAGGLYGDLTAEQFPKGTAYRNPTLAEIAKTLGFVNRFGRGINRAQRVLQTNGSPAPDFQLQPNFFLATVWRRT